LPIIICLYVSIRSLIYIKHTHSLQMTILRYSFIQFGSFCGDHMCL
jgi:hypothetical protein